MFGLPGPSFPGSATEMMCAQIKVMESNFLGSERKSQLGLTSSLLFPFHGSSLDPDSSL